MSQSVPLLPSQLRTSTTTAPGPVNTNARGIILYLSVTQASGTGGLKVGVQAVDSVSGSSGTLFVATTAVTTQGIFVYVLYPGLGVSLGNQSANAILPVNWNAFVTHNDASNYTYSLSADLVQ